MSEMVTVVGAGLAGCEGMAAGTARYLRAPV